MEINTLDIEDPPNSSRWIDRYIDSQLQIASALASIAKALEEQNDIERFKE